MERIATIEYPFNCPYRFEDNHNRMICGRSYNECSDKHIFPNRCPLEVRK